MWLMDRRWVWNILNEVVGKGELGRKQHVVELNRALGRRILVAD